MKTMKEEIEQSIRNTVATHKKEVIEEELPPLKEVVEFTEDADLLKDISSDEIKKTEE